MDDLTVEEKNNIVGTEPTKEATTQVVEEKKWTSKKELAEICNCDVRTLTNIIDSFNKENDFLIENHMKKGGYNNLQVFYDDDLVKAIQLKLKQNGVSQGKQIGIIKLVKGVDYAERIFGEDCYPTTLISSTEEDKIYDRYDI